MTHKLIELLVTKLHGHFCDVYDSTTGQTKPGFSDRHGYVVTLDDMIEAARSDDDYVTHHADWRKACEIARDHSAPATADADDASYWQHQIDVLDRLAAKSGMTCDDEGCPHFGKPHSHA